MSETAYAMWNPSFLHRTWDKRRKAAGLPEKFKYREKQRQYCATHRARLARPVEQRAADVASKLTDAELTALFAEMAAMTTDTLTRVGARTMKGQQDEDDHKKRSCTWPRSGC